MNDSLLWEYNMFEVPFEIQELWLKCTLMLNKSNINDSANIWYSELMTLCKEYVSKMKPSVNIDWEDVAMPPQALLLLVNTLATEAFGRASENDKDVFKIRVEWPDETLKEFKKNNKDKIKELERLERETKSPREKKDNEYDAILQEILTTVKRLGNQQTHWLVVSWGNLNVGWLDWFEDNNQWWYSKVDELVNDFESKKKKPKTKVKITNDMSDEQKAAIIEKMSSKSIL